MKNIFRRSAVFAAALGMALTSFSCAGKNSSADESGHGNLVGNSPPDGIHISEDEMPYGSTVTQLKIDVPVPIEYDYRYMTEEEGRKISEYFSAVGLKDADMLSEVSYDSYLEYNFASLNVSSLQEYVEGYYDSIKSYTGEDYEFSYFIVSDVTEDESVYPYYDNIINDINPDAKIESRKVATVDVYYDTESAKGRSLYNQVGDYIKICVYQIDGQVYIMG